MDKEKEIIKKFKKQYKLFRITSIMLSSKNIYYITYCFITGDTPVPNCVKYDEENDCFVPALFWEYFKEPLSN